MNTEDIETFLIDDDNPQAGWRPPEETLNSFRQSGQMEAITVMRGDGGRFTLLDGSIRLRCAKALGWTKIKAIIVG